MKNTICNKTKENDIFTYLMIYSVHTNSLPVVTYLYMQSKLYKDVKANEKPRVADNSAIVPCQPLQRHADRLHVTLTVG